MTNVKNLLPIGSVVRLREAKKDLMIFGICQTAKSNGKLYDYIGVLWPEGNMGPQAQVMFAHADIDTVVFVGYDAPERQNFIERLNAFYEAQN